MQRFTSLDLQRNTARVQDTAMRAPVAVSYHGRDRLVIMSVEEFERLKRRDKAVIDMHEMPDEFLRALEEPYHNTDQAALDHLMDD